jgi:hypothetical protein
MLLIPLRLTLLVWTGSWERDKRDKREERWGERGDGERRRGRIDRKVVLII